MKTILRCNAQRQREEEGTYISEEDQSRKGRLACPHQTLQSSKPGAEWEAWRTAELRMGPNDSTIL